jgi:predicted esterase
MRKRKILIVSICIIGFVAVSAFSQKENLTAGIKSYQQIEDSLDVLYDLEKYDEGIELIYKHRDDFPDYGYELSNSLTIFYRATEQYEKCMDVWEEGHKKGFFYGIFPVRRYDPFKEYKRFESIMNEDTRLREIANQNTKTIYEVLAPKELEPGKQYPLLIVLHGGGSSIARAKEHWQSEMLEKDYIVTFLQSYFQFSTNTWAWRESDPRTHEDIQKIYRDMISKYPVDTSKVVIGGISAGGSAAVDISMNEIIPAAGLIGVCPGMPEEFNSEMAGTLQKKGFRAFVIGGEKDFYLEHQNKMALIFEEVNLPHKQIVIEGMGHQYPDKFSEWIDSALKYILHPEEAG